MVSGVNSLGNVNSLGTQQAPAEAAAYFFCTEGHGAPQGAQAAADAVVAALRAIAGA